MKILMDDDDEALLSFFSEALEKRGFETHQCERRKGNVPSSAAVQC